MFIKMSKLKRNANENNFCYREIMCFQFISTKLGFNHREVVKRLSEKLSRHMCHWREHMGATIGCKGGACDNLDAVFANVPNPFGGSTFI